jgi:hypothetical protein
LVLFLLKWTYGIDLPNIDFQGALNPLLEIFRKSKKSNRLTSEDYLSFLLGDKPINQEEIEKIAENLLPVDDKNPEKNSRLIKLVCNLSPFVWRYGSKIFKIRNGNVEINLDPSDLPFSTFPSGDLDADTLADIIENMNE